jgi:superfamily I DNA/RNA helicase
MSHVKCERTLWLSRSWRFGNGIANLAYAILRRWRGCGVPLRGSGPHTSIFEVDRDGPHAVLSRTNAFLFAEAARLAVAGRPFHYAGGIEGYRLDQVLSGYHLMMGRINQVTDPFMRSFESFHQYRDYGDQVDDKEVRALVSVVEEHRHEIPRLVQLIRAVALATPLPEAVTLATAHKAKGLEWMDVVLTDDFVDLVDRKGDDGRWVGPEREEVNILYVAVTRALRGLVLPDRLADWLVRENLYRSVTRDQPLDANLCVA